jgi:hypothetical protein
MWQLLRSPSAQTVFVWCYRVLTLDIPSRRVLANGGGALGKFDLLPLTRFFSRQWKAEKKIAEDARDFLFVPQKKPFFRGHEFFVCHWALQQTEVPIQFIWQMAGLRDDKATFLSVFFF